MQKSKYEIMVLLNPKADAKKLEDFFTSVFKVESVKKFEHFEKLERTDLAYEINKSLKAQYFLAVLEADRALISEFTRLANIDKDIWRHLVINLDTEKGLGKKFKINGRVVRTDRNEHNKNNREDNSEKATKKRVVRKAKDTNSESTAKKTTKRVKTTESNDKAE